MEYTQILTSPVQTEKAVRGATEKQYTFYVHKDANKIEIMHAIQLLYGVKPKTVRVSRLPSKTTGRGRIKRKEIKKAIVILHKKDSLDPLKLKKK